MNSNTSTFCNAPIWIAFVVLGIILIFLSRTNLLKEPTDASAPSYKYSFSRSQFAWWLWIIFSCFAGYFFCTYKVPVPNATVLWVLGISGATISLAVGMDAMNAANNVKRNIKSDVNRTVFITFLKEILSDGNGFG